MNFEESILYYLFVNIAPGLGALLAYLLKLHKHKLGKYIFILLLIPFTIEAMVEVHYQLNLGRNVFFNSISNLLNLTVVSFFIYEFTNRQKTFKYIALFLIALVGVFLVYIEGFNNYAPLAYSIQELSVILLCFYYFYHVFQYETEVSIAENPVFLLICLLLLFHCGSLFTSIMILQITEDMDSYILYDLQLALDSILIVGMITILMVIYRLQKKGYLIKP